MLQAYDLGLEDFQNLEGCRDPQRHLSPDVVQAIHAAYLDGGATWSRPTPFGANLSALGEYDVPDRIADWLRPARASPARRRTRPAPRSARRYVLGSMDRAKAARASPVPYAILRDAYQRQAGSHDRQGHRRVPGRDLPGPPAGKGAVNGAAPALLGLTSRSSSSTSRSKPRARCCWAARSAPHSPLWSRWRSTRSA